jgi:4-amino-4-deoxy-L-arabinose transferase-like glycosyltransferase
VKLEFNRSALKEFCWFLLFASSVVWLMGSIELAHDEAYYWMWSRHLDWGYFDQPPLIAWLIALTENWISGEWGVRLAPFLALLIAAAWIGHKLVPPEKRWLWWAGWIIFPLLSFVPSFAVPDTALLATALLFLWTLDRYIERDSWDRALVLSVTSVLMLYAKYHGILLIAGAIVGLPVLLKRRSFWLAAALGCLLFLPHALWEWRHNLPSVYYYLFQSHNAEFSWLRPLEFLLQQALIPGVFLAPWIWLRAWRGRYSSPFHRALAGMVIVTLTVFFCFSFTKNVEGNWTMVAYLCLLVLVLRAPGEWPLHQRWFVLLGICSVILVVAVKLLMSMPGTETWATRLKEVRGWKAWSLSVAQNTSDCDLIANTYQVAAKLSFYAQREIPSLNMRSRANQFDFWRWQKWLRGKPVCWLTDSKGYPGAEWVTPQGNTLRLVRNMSLEELLASKASGSGVAIKKGNTQRIVEPVG